jgi:hypothetical protein
MDMDYSIQDSNKNDNYKNYRLEESSNYLNKKRKNFYGDLTYLNESTNETQVKYLPYFYNSSTNLDENTELGNVNISNESLNDNIMYEL